MLKLGSLAYNNSELLDGLLYLPEYLRPLKSYDNKLPQGFDHLINIWSYSFLKIESR